MRKSLRRALLFALVALGAPLMLAGCGSLPWASTNPTILEQAEYIAIQRGIILSQGLVLDELRDGNIEIGYLLGSLAWDLSDLRAWQAQWEPFTRRLEEIYHRNRHIWEEWGGLTGPAGDGEGSE